VNGWRKIAVFGLALLLLAGCAASAVACPTCKESLAHDPASANLVRGYAYSILFMLSMPPLILGGLSAYFYWEVRKAKARQANGSVGNALRGVP
jgi:heme/copper-type cytochrome/quinol oxidase subunit 2